jgi:thiamine-phosphate pyrophosphorylase
MEELFAESPLYAILDAAQRRDLSAIDILEALLQAGVRVIQYRHKEPFHRNHFEECCDLARRAHRKHAAFLVNDRADVAALCGADGVHLGQEDLPPEQARKLLGAKSIIGYSTHSREQAMQAARLPVDYIAVGPIFPTATKQDPDPVVGLGLISEVRKMTARPLVAIGGITLENAASVIAAGADAVAVISGLLGADDINDIEGRAKQYLGALKVARN